MCAGRKVLSTTCFECFPGYYRLIQVFLWKCELKLGPGVPESEFVCHSALLDSASIQHVECRQFYSTHNVMTNLTLKLQNQKLTPSNLACLTSGESDGVILSIQRSSLMDLSISCRRIFV